MHLVYPPKFCISIVSNFSWVLQSSQGKSFTMVMHNFKGWTRCIMAFVKMVSYGVPINMFLTGYSCSPSEVEWPSKRQLQNSSKSLQIDLFTNTAAIFKLLDLRSIMGCPGGPRSVLTRPFRAKRELQCAFLGKKAMIITAKHGTTIFFSHYNLFLGKRKDKLVRKARVNTERVYRIPLMPPGHPIILLKSN